jgi:hypothetical protein
VDELARRAVDAYSALKGALAAACAVRALGELSEAALEAAFFGAFSNDAAGSAAAAAFAAAALEAEPETAAYEAALEAARGDRLGAAPDADPAAPLDAPSPPRAKRARMSAGSAAQPAAAQPVACMEYYHPYMESLRSMGYTTPRTRTKIKLTPERLAKAQPVRTPDVVGDGSAAAPLWLAPPAGPRALAAAALDREVQRVVNADGGAGVYSMAEDNTLSAGTATFLAALRIAHGLLLGPGADAGAPIPVDGRLLAQITTGPDAAGDALSSTSATGWSAMVSSLPTRLPPTPAKRAGRWRARPRPGTRWSSRRRSSSSSTRARAACWSSTAAATPWSS